MEIVLAALIASFGTVIVALISRGNTRADKGREAAVAANLTAVEAAKRAEDLAAHVQTNGSNMTLGELAEAIFRDGRDTKNAVRRLERKVDAHHSRPASVAHPAEEEVNG